MCKNIYYTTSFVLLLGLLLLFNTQAAVKLYAGIVTKTPKDTGANITVISEVEYERPYELLHPKNKLAEKLSTKICTIYE